MAVTQVVDQQNKLINGNSNFNQDAVSNAGFKYLKMPRNVSEYTLMRGVTDFSNLKQFDLYETGYSFLTVVNVSRFMEILAKQDPYINELQEGFIHILECEFKGLDGISNVTSETGDISNGIDTTQFINKVTEETSTDVSMSFYERSGALLTKYIYKFLTGIKDPHSGAKTYHGLIGNAINDPGPDYETFTFLYYVTDNTMKRIEMAYLLANAQPNEAQFSDLYNAKRGEYSFQEINLSFKCYPIRGNTVNKYAALMLSNDLTTTDDSRRIILNHNDFKYKAFSYATDSGRGSRVASILSGSDADILKRASDNIPFQDLASKSQQQS